MGKTHTLHGYSILNSALESKKKKMILYAIPKVWGWSNVEEGCVFQGNLGVPRTST